MSVVNPISKPCAKPVSASSCLCIFSISSLMPALSKAIGFLSVEAPIVMGRAGTLSLASPRKGGLCLANRKSGLAFFFDVIFFHGRRIIHDFSQKYRGHDKTAHKAIDRPKKRIKGFFE